MYLQLVMERFGTERDFWTAIQ